jgi:sigma54-dependent transcription regulator
MLCKYKFDIYIHTFINTFLNHDNDDILPNPDYYLHRYANTNLTYTYIHTFIHKFLNHDDDDILPNPDYYLHRYANTYIH